MPKIPTDIEKRISIKFQKRLTELIDENDCTKYEFAELAHVSKNSITQAVLLGLVPTVSVLVRIADYLEISLPYLLGEVEENEFYKSDTQSNFHERLEQLTTEMGTNYGKIAHKMPFSRNFFYAWIRTKTLPSLEYLKALAEYFEVSIDYLLGRTDYRD